MPLTDVQIRGAKAREKVCKLSDGGGLQCWIMPSGGKLWYLAYRTPERKQKKLALGAYPAVGLSDARRKRDEAKAHIAAGKDPSDMKRVEKLTRAISNATTFKAVADEYLAKIRNDGRAPSTLDKVAWLLGQAHPGIGSRPIAEIKPQEVLAVLKAVEVRGKLESARRLRAYVGSVFKLAIASGRATENPAASLDRALLTPKVKHRPAIVDPIEFGALLRAIDGYNGNLTTRAALQLLALLFTRPGELRLAQWAEFDFDKAVWTIPAGRMKMRREHLVPLPKQAQKILASLKLITGNGKFLFPGTRSVTRSISDGTMNAALHRMGYSKDQVCPHGFRTSASTILNESGIFSPDSIERALSHEDKNEIRRAYNRGSYWVERVRMAEWWADCVDKLKQQTKL